MVAAMGDDLVTPLVPVFSPVSRPTAVGGVSTARPVQRARRARALCAMAAATLACAAPSALACNWSIIDHKVHEDKTGAWNPSIYRGVLAAATAAQIGGALWEGADTRFGKTMWQGIDSQLIGVASSEVMKRAFTRVRPTDTNDPCEFFAHGANHSFPSGEAASAAALVTPYVLEYAQEYPAAYGLLLLPLYVGAGRVKAQAHWQSDVLAGWTVGALAGLYAHDRETPILIQVLPHGIAVGLKVRF